MEACKRDENCPCFIIIRYPMSLSQTCKNSLTKQLPIHGNYEGRVSGVCPRIDVKEGAWAWDKGVAIMYFQSREAANLWYVSVPDIKQQDWLGGVDMVLVPACSTPDPGSIRFLQMIDLQFHDFDRFSRDYSPEASEAIRQHGGFQLVSTSNAVKLRGLWEPSYIVLNSWGSEECFQRAYGSSQYDNLLFKRQACSTASMCVFGLEPLIPPRCGDRTA